MVYAVSTDPENADGIAAQTTGALRELESLLDEAGSGKDRILQATVYLADIADKSAMDAIWNLWIGAAKNWPQRACVGVALDTGCLFEIVVTAAVK
ncbi:RidA family protein [Sulfitobacter sp. TSTF-M16]|uniref:RidA family protein n=1 Tax=Sulfitobacter aestuariivivens TaxID=2766981 RepID=A0A927D830_9RHOB|nr:RidA family protein [Sulfitobacter aestuariivivens]